MNDHQYDIIMIGAGLVGTSLIAALQNAGLRMAVLETHIPSSPVLGADSRPLSLTYSSQKILAALGIWPEMTALAVPILAVHVSEQKRFGALHFDAREESVPALGYVVPFDELQNRLYQRAAESPTVKFISYQKLTRIDYVSGKIVVSAATAQGEEKLAAELLVAADGTHSPTRELLGIATREQSAGEVAWLLTVELTEPHRQVAYERFIEQGILALLPLQNPYHYRVVWTLPQHFWEKASLWTDDELARYLRAAMQERLGNWRILTRGRTWPLQVVLAEEQIRPQAVLLGNAAHTIYPLAAQGFNLGLRDAATLAEILSDARRRQQSLGDERVLKAYRDWRSADQRLISGWTTGLSQLFGLRLPGLGVLRGAGLLTADLMPPFKRRLARRFMGLSGRCPQLVRGISL